MKTREISTFHTADSGFKYKNEANIACAECRLVGCARSRRLQRDISRRTPSRLLAPRRGPPSQTAGTFMIETVPSVHVPATTIPVGRQPSGIRRRRWSLVPRGGLPCSSFRNLWTGVTLRIPGCSPARPPSVHRAKYETHHTLLCRGGSLCRCASPQGPPRRLCGMSCASYDGWDGPEVPAPNWAARQRDNSTFRPRSSIVTDRRERIEARGAPCRSDMNGDIQPGVAQSGDGRECRGPPWMRTAGDISGWSALDGGAGALRVSGRWRLGPAGSGV
jgi:hypothetical protein